MNLHRRNLNYTVISYQPLSPEDVSLLSVSQLLPFKPGLRRYCRSITPYPILKSKTLKNKASLLTQMAANSTRPKYFPKQKLT